MSTVTYTVTVVSTGSGNKYFINGNQQSSLNLFEGITYKFDQSAGSNSSHPLRFSTTSDGTHSGGSEYTTNVTTSGTPGSSGAYTQIVIGGSTPNLYYYCTNHSGMGGIATTEGTLNAGWGRLTWGSGPWSEEFLPVTVSASSVSAASVIGSPTITAAQSITVSVTGVTADVFPEGGWGRSTWGSGGWSTPVGVTVIQGSGTSVSATALLMSSSISSVTTIEGGGITVGVSSGVEAVGQTGAAFVRQELVTVTGVSAAATVSSVQTGLGFGVTPITAAAGIGSVSITQGTGISVSATSVSAASTVNSVTTTAGTGVTTTVSSVLTTSHIGNVNVPDVLISVLGVSAQGLVGTPTVWSEIIPGQNAGWTEITDTQSPGWTEIAA